MLRRKTKENEFEDYAEVEIRFSRVLNSNGSVDLMIMLATLAPNSLLSLDTFCLWQNTRDDNVSRDYIFPVPRFSCLAADRSLRSEISSALNLT
jgi:hypothetical protein